MAIGQTIASEVRRLRHGRGWTQQNLADRLAEIGAPLNRMTLAKIEAGGTRAENLSVADLLVLAAALDTSPVSLVFPAGRVEIVEATPELRIFSGLASKWFCAEEALTDERHLLVMDRGEWLRATAGTRYYREADWLSEGIREARKALQEAEYVGVERRIKDAKAGYSKALHALANHYDRMEREGIAPPGETPETVKAWKAIGIEVPKHWLWVIEREGKPKGAKK